MMSSDTSGTSEIDIFVTTTGDFMIITVNSMKKMKRMPLSEALVALTMRSNCLCFKIITMAFMKRMKSNAIVGSTGRPDNEIKLVELEDFPNIKVGTSSPELPGLSSLILMASSCLQLDACVSGQRDLHLCYDNRQLQDHHCGVDEEDEEQCHCRKHLPL